ncbi:MAG: MoaD/ThiS family protein [Chloroflexi bacterium]|nr:MoaD/ThiS family protein [Chloroflexota bacterium]MDA1241121.1 MoaD/ThiS family protein [Chloroflexota bacterium]MQC48477.1 MoaD/ThiS family protein [Chloroflexota bacterium]
MAVVHVPASLEQFTGGQRRYEVAGTTLREVFEALRQVAPDLVPRILDGDDIRSDIAVAIDGSILEGGELVQTVDPDTEIYLVPPIGGGGWVSRTDFAA